MKRALILAAVAALLISCTTPQMQAGIATAQSICAVIDALGTPVGVYTAKPGDKGPVTVTWMFSDGTIVETDGAGMVLETR